MKSSYSPHSAMILLAMLFIFSCAKDQGSDLYRPLNRLLVQNSNGENFAGTRFIVQRNENRIISPTVSGSTMAVNEGDLNFTWIIGKDTLSKEKSLTIQTEAILPGEYTGKLIIKDQSTQLSYSFSFSVLVMASVGNGSYVLAVDEGGQTRMYMFAEEPEKHVVSIHTFEQGPLGPDPVALEVSYRVNEDRTLEYKRLLIVTKDGRFPMVALDFNTLKTSFVVPTIGAFPDGTVLRPSYFQSDHVSSLNQDKFDGILLIGGKCYNFVNGMFSGDIYWQDPLNYDFGTHGVIYTGSSKLKGSFISGFDRRSERIRVFDNALTGGGIYWNNSDDKQYFPSLTEGKEFLASASNDPDKPTWIYLLKKDNLVTMLETTSEGLNPSRLEILYQYYSNTLADGIGFFLKEDYWYFAHDRTIYRFPKNSLYFEPYLRLPEDQTGRIVSWKFSLADINGKSKIAIATFKEDAPMIKKGSFYLYDRHSMNLERKDLFALDRAVDMRVCY
ncbi:MAG: hypothetical protein ACI35Z_08265 [Sphingobacterium hotanense]